MDNILLSLTEPVSSIPKEYSQFLKRVNRKNEPIVFLRRNKPVGALIGWDLLRKLFAFRQKLEEEKALEKIFQSEKEYKQGKAKNLKSLKDLNNKPDEN